MSSQDIKCRIIEEELKSIWPDWHVARRLGDGAFGDVFQIYRDNFGIRVDSALKVIRIDNRMGEHKSTAALLLDKREDQEYQKDQEYRKDSEDQEESHDADPGVFFGEIRIMEELRGAPNIVTIEDFYLKKNGPVNLLFVRMELLTSLQDLISERQEQTALSSIGEICRFGRDICTALMYCEKKGIIHRDIKPENLFVDRFGDYKVGDFGASKRLDAIHVAQTMTGIGTISYMAPEVFQGRSYNNTVDIYSLGLVLYQLLNNGRIPFLPSIGTYTTQEIDYANNRRLQGNPVPSLAGHSVGKEQIDSRLDTVVRKACAVNPLDRYQTAKEFYDALYLSDTAEKKSAAGSVNTFGKDSDNTALSVSHQEPQKPSVGRKSMNLIVFLIVFVLLSLAVWQARTGLFNTFFGSDTETEAGNRESTEEETVSVSISDSWEEIIASGDDGSYLEKYRIGDTKELDLGEEGLIVMELVAFDADELADGSGKAHMTWIAKDLLNSEHSITLNTEMREHSGWLESDMRSWLRESVLPLFPEMVRSNIRKVKKYSNVYSYGTYVSADTIWIPSTREIFGEDRCKEKQGPEYKTAFLDASSRNRQHIGGSGTSLWWTRSASTDAVNHFECVGYRDYSSINVTGNELGVVVGFCL